MLTILVWAISILLICIGFLGCFIHKFPGPVLAVIGLLVFVFGIGVTPIPWVGIAICVVALILTSLSNRIFIPMITRKISEFGTGGRRGALIGSILGFLIILGASGANISEGWLIPTLLVAFVVIPFVCALIGEKMNQGSWGLALKPATAAFLAFFLGMVLKLFVCGFCVYVIITNGK